MLTNPLTVSTLALRYSVSTVSASFLLRYYYWVLSVDLNVIKRQYASFELRLSVSSSVTNVAQSAKLVDSIAASTTVGASFTF